MSAAARDSWATFFFCLLVGGLIFSDTLRYPEVQGQGFGQGPAFYPRLLAGVLMFLGCVILVQGLHSRGDKAVAGEEAPANHGISYRPVILLNILCIVLVALMGYTGFFVSAFVLTFLTMFIIRRSWKIRYVIEGLIFSLAMVFLIYLVFEVFVGIQLPKSTLF